MQITVNNLTYPSYGLLATKIYCKVDMIFTASDGNKYYIPTGKGEVSEAVRGDSDYPQSRLQDFELIEFINNNKDRWELDVE